MKVSKQDKFRVGEAAKILEVSAATLRRWDASGRLPAFREEGNGQRYYTRAQLLEFAANQRKIKHARSS